MLPASGQREYKQSTMHACIVIFSLSHHAQQFFAQFTSYMYQYPQYIFTLRNASGKLAQQLVSKQPAQNEKKGKKLGNTYDVILLD